MTTTSGAGRRMARFSITIPNYSRYQQPMKEGGRRVWVRFDRTTPQDPKIAALSWPARGVFLFLVMLSDEGLLTDVSIRSLARLLSSDHRSVEAAIGALEDGGLIGITTSEMGAKWRRNRRQLASEPLMPFAQSLGLKPPTDRQTDIPPSIPQKGEVKKGRKQRLPSFTFKDLSQWEQEGFEAFWKLFPRYPGRRVRSTAEQAWVNKVCRRRGAEPWTPELQERVMASLATQMEMHRRNRSFELHGWSTFPGPTPWLNKLLFMDEPEEPVEIGRMPPGRPENELIGLLQRMIQTPDDFPASDIRRTAEELLALRPDLESRLHPLLESIGLEVTHG